MLEHFTPDDKEEDDTELHKQATARALEYADTDNDIDFTVEETRNAVASMNNKKYPGVNGITGEVYKSTFEVLPRFTTAMYNYCLRRGVFPKRWKTAKLIPIVKPGKENSDDVSKFRPTSLLNTEGKVLEKLLINRINHHVFSHDIVNKNQFGFTPQSSTTDAAMTVKGFIEEGLSAGEIIVLISLDAKGAFDAAWWPSILNGLKDYNCPKKLCKLSKSYFSQRTAVLSLNNVSMQRTITKGTPQVSCCGPRYWKILCISLLNIKFTKISKAFAEDLLLAIRNKTVRAAENISNIEMNKIIALSMNNKINCDEDKSKVMIISRRREKKTKKLTYI